MSTRNAKGRAPRPPFKGATITDIELHMDGESGPHALSCLFEGHRYHVWLNDKTFKPVDTVLYKNPRSGVLPTDPGFFRTRRLSTESTFGRWLVHTMREEMMAKGLIEAGREQSRQAQAELEIARAREKIARRKVEAADELYDLLQAFCQRFGEQDPELGEQARSLLQRIENGH